MAIELSDAEYEAALARGRDRLLKPHVTQARYDARSHLLTVSFSSSFSFSFDPAQVDILKEVPEAALSKAYVTPGGDGLIFGDDEDTDSFAVSLPGLLKSVMPAQDWDTAFEIESSNLVGDARRIRKGSVNEKLAADTDLMARLTHLIDEFCLAHLPSREFAKPRSELLMRGYLHSFVASSAPDLDIQQDRPLIAGQAIRADFLVTRGSETVVIDLKLHSRRRTLKKDLAHMWSNLRLGGFKNGMLVLLPDHAAKMKKTEAHVDHAGTRLIVLSPA